MIPTTTATHNGKDVAILRKGKKSSRICSVSAYKGIMDSDETMGTNDKTSLVPNSELKNVSKPQKTKKKKKAATKKSA